MCVNLTVAGWVFVPLIGIACVAGGYYALVKWIPKNAGKEVRTDIYSARISCYVIGVGLVILTLWVISTLVIRTLVMLKAYCVI
jgi:hypothetical protein